MAKYVLAYKGGGMPQSEEEQQKVMAAWNDWFSGLGSAVVDIGNPFGPSTSLGGNGSTSGLTGYSIINAATLEDAKGKAKGCPILDGGGGSVEIYEALAM